MKQKVPCTLMEGSVFSKAACHPCDLFDSTALPKKECIKFVVNSRIHEIGKKATPIYI